MGATLATLIVFAAQVGVEAGARSESRTGEAPLIPGSDSRAFVAQVLTPAVALDVTAPGQSARLQYLPRIYWQDPRPTSQSGPLVLHTAALTLDLHPSQTTTLVMAATGYLGQPDYTSLTQVLGTTTQGTLPVVSTVASAAGRLSIASRVTARTRLDLSSELFRWWSLDDVAPQLVDATVTSQTRINIQPAATFRLSTRNDLGALVNLGGIWYSTGARYLTVTPAAVWTMRLTAESTMRSTLGFAYSHPLAVDAAAVSRVDAFSPSGSVELDVRAARWERVAVDLNAQSGVNLFFDPVLGTADPRAFARAGVVVTVAPDWTASLRGDFATGPQPQGQPTGDVTVYAISAAGRRLLSSNLFVELGGMWGDRGPALSASSFAFHQPQRWVFVSLTGTTRNLSRTGGR